MSDEDTKAAEATEEKPAETPTEASKEVAEESTTPPWLLGSGVDTDMKGDPSTGAGASLRYWMPKGSEKNVIFLTDGNAAPVLWEHQIRLGGKWTNWCSCVRPLGVKCPVCDWADTHSGDFRRYKGMYFTVIDTSKFTDKSGVERGNLKKLLCAKKDSAEILKRKYVSCVERGDGLRGAMFKVYRANSDKSAAIGSDFEFIKMVDMAAIKDATELDYAKLLTPNPEQAQRMMDAVAAERVGGDAAPAAAPASEGAGDAAVSY